MAIKFYKLLDVLNKRNLSKGDLKKLAGISSVTMARISKGDSITTEVLNRICAALDIQPGELMEYVPDEDDSN
jgi:DNA-binding Xre family transcriptional regulator